MRLRRMTNEVSIAVKITSNISNLAFCRLSQEAVSLFSPNDKQPFWVFSGVRDLKSDDSILSARLPSVARWVSRQMGSCLPRRKQKS